PAFRALMDLAEAIYHLTEGAFDPTVQPLWQAAAEGHRNTAPIGWHHVQRGPGITLKPGMALTFNGIAQGFGADAVKAHLAAHGFDHALIDMGEAAAIGGPFRLGLRDPIYGQLATRALQGTAIATSLPKATLVNGQPHILHPHGLPPLWSTVSVEATSAALADALSTALVFLTADQIAALHHPGLIRVTLVDPDGNLTTILNAKGPADRSTGPSISSGRFSPPPSPHGRSAP
ncbi:MAG TPA: FAD:protein FMN transferase, partial [Tabrizicola sp.]|nr:FAD:protein FMN transferase [Tabrizicola sp.]